jgi:hypothetical protein
MRVAGTQCIRSIHAMPVAPMIGYCYITPAAGVAMAIRSGDLPAGTAAAAAAAAEVAANSVPWRCAAAAQSIQRGDVVAHPVLLLHGLALCLTLQLTYKGQGLSHRTKLRTRCLPWVRRRFLADRPAWCHISSCCTSRLHTGPLHLRWRSCSSALSVAAAGQQSGHDAPGGRAAYFEYVKVRAKALADGRCQGKLTRPAWATPCYPPPTLTVLPLAAPGRPHTRLIAQP